MQGGNGGAATRAAVGRVGGLAGPVGGVVVALHRGLQDKGNSGRDLRGGEIGELGGEGEKGGELALEKKEFVREKRPPECGCRARVGEARG